MPSAFAKLTTTTETTFRILTVLTGLYAVYKWLYFTFVYQGAWPMAEAMTWTVIAAVLFLPAAAINYVRGD